MKTFCPWNVFSCLGKNDDSSAPHQVSTFRRILPQVILKEKISDDSSEMTGIILFFPQFISSVPLFLMAFDLGFSFAIATIVVPSVRGASEQLNPDETISMTPDEASWLGKLCME